jgi:hypothetical protein
MAGGGARVIPVTNKEVAALLSAGHTADELAERWNVGGQAVRRAGRAGGWSPGHTTQAKVPWLGLGPASHSPAARGLRAHARVKEGQRLTPANQTTYDNWKKKMDAEGLVVMRDPKVGPNEASPSAGILYYAKRRPDTPDDEYFQYPIETPA